MEYNRKNSANENHIEISEKNAIFMINLILTMIFSKNITFDSSVSDSNEQKIQRNGMQSKQLFKK